MRDFLKATLVFAGVSAFFPALVLAGDPLAVPKIIDADAINWKASPCDDFYKFACGQWLDDLQMPADKATYYHQFTALDDQTREVIRELIASAPAGSKIADFYSSCMNQDAAAKSAKNVLRSAFATIDAITDARSLATAVAQLHLGGTDVLFGFGPAQDLNNAAQVIGFAGQGGMSLPERDYYLKTDDKSVETRNRFVEHVAKALVLSGAAGSAAAPIEAAQILAFETALARVSYSLEDQGDPSKINHPMTLGDLKSLVPSFDWNTYFAALDVTGGLFTLNVTEPDFYAGLDKLLELTPLEQLKVYLKWHVIERSASLAGGELEAEAFSFWNAYLRGAKEREPRWKRCVNIVSSDMGDEVGRAYVASLKNADEVKQDTRGIIEQIKGVFSTNLDSLAWLDAPTVAAARAKLAQVNDKVAFPDRWKDYSALTIDPVTLLANDIRATEYESRRGLAKIGKPVDRSEWYMPAWEINAYYDPSMNEIVFPYGILQNPVFDVAASTGANMGALGATVGHELTHGFDNDGSKYDGMGNVKSWWPDRIRAQFEERAQCLINQANRYEVLPGLFVNGRRTLTENIADQGGTKLAYLAYKNMTEGHKPAEPVLGLNEDQQFFVSYAQSWCAKRTDASMRLLLNSNVHPPEEFRVNGVLMNMPAFAEAFGCREGSRMAPVNRCGVW